MSEIHEQMDEADRQRKRFARAGQIARTAFGYVTLLILIISLFGGLVFSRDPSTQKMWGILIVYSPIVGLLFAVIVNIVAAVFLPREPDIISEDAKKEPGA